MQQGLLAALLTSLVPAAVTLPAHAAETGTKAGTASPAASLSFADGAATSGWLPFESVGGTRIFLPAQIDGHPVLAMLDSGASATVLDRHFARSIGLAARGDLAGGGGGGGGSYGTIKDADITLGAATLRGSPAVAIDLAAVQRQLGRPLPVILGGDVFRDLIVDLDFQHHLIAFRDPRRFQAPRGASIAPLSAAGDNKAITMEVEGRPARMLFDLGNGHALSLFPKFWDRPEILAGRRLSTTLTGGWGGMSVQKLAMIKALDVGGATFTDVPAIFEHGRDTDVRKGKLDGNVGIRVLSRFHLIVDYPHGRVLFDPPADVATAFAVDHSGLTLRPAATGAEILYVAPGSPALAAGLKTGDEIVGVRDAAGAAKSLADNGWLAGKPGEVLEVGLAGGGTRTLVLATYY